jgi:hypothetical protein
MLSLSFWRDEEAVKNWRQFEAHRMAQARGRNTVFADYRLRVASVLRDYGMSERAEAPADSLQCVRRRRFRITESATNAGEQGDVSPIFANECVEAVSELPKRPLTQGSKGMYPLTL